MKKIQLLWLLQASHKHPISLFSLYESMRQATSLSAKVGGACMQESQQG